MSLSLKQLQSQIKNNEPRPIYLVLGTDQYLISKTKQIFRSMLNPEESEMNFAKFDLQKISLGPVLDEAMSAPFFGDHRLIFAENPTFLTGENSKSSPENDLTTLESYLAEPEPTSVLVFIAPYEKLDGRKKIVKQLNKVAETIDVSIPDEKQIRQFVQTRIKEQGYSISSEALDELISRTDANLSILTSELDKLMLYAIDSKNIEIQIVDHLVTKSLETNVFSLVNAVLSHDVDSALTIYNDLRLQKEEPIKLIAILISQFRLFLQVKILLEKGYTQGNLAQVLKVHPYRIKLAIQQVHKFDKQALKNAYLGLETAETKMKNGSMDKDLIFELFIMEYVQGKILQQA